MRGSIKMQKKAGKEYAEALERSLRKRKQKKMYGCIEQKKIKVMYHRKEMKYGNGERN